MLCKDKVLYEGRMLFLLVSQNPKRMVTSGLLLDVGFLRNLLMVVVLEVLPSPFSMPST